MHVWINQLKVDGAQTLFNLIVPQALVALINPFRYDKQPRGGSLIKSLITLKYIMCKCKQNQIY